MRLRWLAVLVLLFASFMDLLDTTIVNVALPAIEQDLGTTPEQLEWIVSGYVLTFAVLLTTGGRLGDIFGRKRLFLIGVAGFTVASASCALATSGDMLVISRLVQGAFGAIMIPQVLSIIQVLFGPKERAGAFGALGAITGLAAVAGPLVGGILVSQNAFGLGWRSVFIINVPVGIALFITAALCIPESRAAKRVRLDVVGVVLISAALFLLVFGLIEGRALDWPVGIWLMIGASPVLLAVFIWYQNWLDKKTGSALVPPSLFHSRGFSAGVLTSFSFSASIGGFFLILVLYLQIGLGFSAIEAGLTTLPFSLAALVGTGIAVRFGPRLGKGLIFVGAITQIGGYVWVRNTVAAQADSLVGFDLVPMMAVAGLGLTLLVVPLTDVSLAQTSISNAGAASGVLGTFQQVGGAIGIAVVGVVFFGVVGMTFTPAVLRDAFLAGIWVPIVALSLAALASMLLPNVAQVAHHKVEAERALEEEDRQLKLAV
ncbi:DHA2 family efflux MFS transporter permease subunit [Cryobacterium sp. CG_9.6]|uniref:DHA2 family efflux MFS transporter permease subunit n=1 Tax=Cryobacterium sp. CG_9.6 TaxID=2760710 RepID=UPI00247599C0|nr:DHA2 family efflux MFS transporter permease subunit [Cryobacterium sp. CG_9.6]MDH6237081.1 EmrB/QacA subfamily drug resistance transporter [Cryobacterium sp. CG_9.6]